MAHTHPVRDTDPKFTINPITRQVSSIDNQKYALMQYDHNSERYTFEIDRYIEDHDMYLCKDKIEIHYINTSSSGEKQPGVYEVNDLKIAGESEDKLEFTWIITNNATKYAGVLSFLISFACVENYEVTYRWQTGINSSITISNGMNNGVVITEPYPDILTEWKNEIFKRDYAYEGAIKNGFEGTEEEWYETVMTWGKTLAIWSAKQNKLSWVTNKDIDDMFNGTYVGSEDDSIEGYYPSYEVVGENLIIQNGVSMDG